MTDEIDEKLARLGRRVEAQRNAVRDELERCGLLGSVEEARARFGAKLVWFKSDRLEVGTEIPAGVVPTDHQPRRVAVGFTESNRPAKRKKSKARRPTQPVTTWHDRID